MNTNVDLAAEELERTQPAGWQPLLFAAVLEKEMAPILGGYVALLWNAPAVPRQLAAVESREFAREKVSEIWGEARRLSRLLDEEIARVWGEPDQPGDALAIRKVCGQIAACCEGFLVWERALRSVEPHPLLRTCYERLRGVTRPWVEQVAALSSQIRNPIAEGRCGELELNLKFDTPSLEDLNLPSVEECSRTRESAPSPACSGISHASDSSWSESWHRFEEGMRSCLFVCLLIAAAMALFIAHPVIGTFVCLFLALGSRK